MFEKPITIAEAIDNIEQNRYLLPAIQREFVWDHMQIERLFDSLMRNYPISSFLFWRVEGDTKTKFKFYSFLKEYREHFKTHNIEFNTVGANDFEAILDGQQRLTALYIGLKGTYAWKKPRVWRVDSEDNIPTRKLYLNVTETLKDDEQGMQYEFKFLTLTEYNSDGKHEKWFEVGKILDLKNNFAFNKFLHEQGYSQSEFTSETLATLHQVIHSDRVINYFLEKDQSIDKALHIFIRVNSGGEPLNFSDLIMSIAIANWTKLDARYHIYKLVDEIRDCGFDIKKDFILKVFLVLYSNDIRFKVNNFSVDNAKQFEDKWFEIRKSILSTIRLIKTFGFCERTLTSKNALIPIIYYIYHKGIYEDFDTKVQHKQEREIIKKWLHLVLLNQSFGASADRVLAAVKSAIKDCINTSQFPTDEIIMKLREIQFFGVDEQFLDSLLYTQKDDHYAFSILALLYPYLDYSNNNFHMDHLHPLSAFRRRQDLLDSGINSRDLDYCLDPKHNNSILNLQMLDGNDNMSKQNVSLAEWVQKENIDIDKRLIPPYLDIKEFRKFIEDRRKLLKDRLTELMK